MSEEFRKQVRQATSAKWRLDDPGDDWCLGVTTVEARYSEGYDACVAAMVEACRRLNLVVTGGDVRPGNARVDARSGTEPSELVRITVQLMEDGACLVSFSAGREWTQDTQDLIVNLREAFECGLPA